ncbi:hypothetical protein MIMGU_mgv1a023807mg [Erythranthe guttata]|uniref:NB-ARC domain-containing protein n=1 Tax=Erythranthe guttata TaxID=4155 RepID=A0A022PR86_ERYGU|nr:PREDICTED: probable disease resistance protein RF9 [Erythranthe guttata]EYU18281.1 hypothetical protein MIMGU_mgv1a023807mg [Erythranthe guttata]|eukprot:XP_012828552.1 PREDICTED: probable disease resistance protein RF9 [Erythranthe guttata]
MRIAESCRGLPIATTIIGGAMRTKNLEEWEGMEQMLRDNMYSSDDTMQRILSIGYNQLPLHLKPCFLYLGYFPRNQPIPVEKLCLLWIAEGFISIRGSNVGKSQMEVAEEYFDELFDRNMVSVAVNEEVPPSARFQSCTLNDSIRDLCIQKGGEEEFFKVARGNITRNLTGRVALCLNTDDIFPLNVSEGNDIRSILFYDMDESHSKQTRPGEFPDLTEFRRTRVLDFDEVDFRVKKLPRGLEKLTYLRHLSFRGCYLHEFTSSLSNFPLLETLDLRVRVSCVMTIQNVLTKLSSLKHLYFPSTFRCDGTEDKLKLDTLTKLQVLENFNACMCDVNDLLQMESLRVLTVYVDGNNTDLKKTTSCLNQNKFLRHSSVVVKNFDSYTKERLSVVAALLECNALHGLNIEGYLGVTPLHEGIGSNFTSMVFNGSEYSEDPMPILGKLRNLRSLVLRNDAFVATKMVCSDESGFPHLTSLEISTLRLLEKWEVRGEVFMPRLAILTIEKCDKLEEIPLGLLKIQTLRKINVRSMPKEFQDKVKKTTNKLMAPFSYEY